MDGARERLTTLLARALAAGGTDSEERWEIVQELHGRTDRVTFELACALTRSAEPAERVLGADILGQLGHQAGRPFAAETLPVLLAAAGDGRPEVVAAAVTALGQLADERAHGAVLRHAGDASADVRLAVAAALPALAGEPPADGAVTALIRLTGDTDPQVRDWATMGLGSQLDVDTPAVRDALAARIDDAGGDTAGEALLGLARRHDGRALAPILARLADDPGDLIIEAATELGTAEALAALRRLADAG
jgi:HEAT repeat protein